MNGGWSEVIRRAHRDVPLRPASLLEMLRDRV